MIFKNLWLLQFITVLLVLLTLIYNHVILYVLLMLWFVKLVTFKHKAVLVGTICFIIISISAYYFRLQLNQSRLPNSTQKGQIVLLSDSVTINGDNLSVLGRINDENVLVKYKLKTEEEQTSWRMLNEDLIVEAEFTLKELEVNRNIHQFNFKQYYKEQKNIYWIVKLHAYKTVDKSFNIRAFWKNKIREHAPRLVTSIILSLIFSETPDEISNLLSDLGILYLFVTTGIHISLVQKGIQKILYRLNITREKTKIFLIVVLCFLSYLSQFKLSVLKYCLLFILPKTITYQDKLSIFGIILMLYNPYIIFNLSFQFAIILSLLANLCQYHRLKTWLCSIPILSFHFFQFHLLTIPIAYIAFYLLKFFVLPMSYFIAVSVLIFPILIQPIISIFNICLEYFVQLLTFINQFEIFKIVTGRLEWYRYILCFIILVIILSMNSRRYIKYVQYVVYLICFLPLPAHRIFMIDVGQGSSLLIQNGYQAIMVDTGGNIAFNTKEYWQQKTYKPLAKSILIPVLKSLGISRLDTVFITHDDSDHSGALSDLKQLMPIENIVYGKGAAIEGTKEVYRPQLFEFNQFKMQLLYTNPNGKGENDDSLILYFKFDEYFWLLMGDASINIEEHIIKLYPNLKIDVLQVGHHGSKTSTSQKFIDYYKPKFSLISVGKNNRFNHPHPQVLKILQDTTIFRTDKQGMISFDNGTWQTTVD